MKYYRLTENMSLPRRRVAYPKQASLEDLPVGSLTTGTPYTGKTPLRTKVAHDGIAADIDMILTIPIVRQSVADLLRGVAGEDIQCIGVEIQGVREPFVAINILRMLDCVDEKLSGIDYATADNPSHGSRKYRTLTNIHVLSAAVGEANIFRIKDWPAAIVVSESIRVVLLENEVSGVVFADA